jgi:hypothetical protein
MSVILDALRKLDREKSFPRDGRTNIAAEILRPDLPHPGKRLPLYFVIITLTAVATAAITYAVVEFGFLTKSSPPPMKAPVTSQQVIPPPPDSPSLSKSSLSSPVNPPAASQQATPAVLSHELAHEIREEREPVPPKIESRIESNPPMTPLREKEASQKVPLEKADVGPANTIKPTEQTSNEPPTAPPPLKLSAIVWYEEPSRRFAMVNGMIIYEGAVIEGVKVEEIHPNHVRFSHSGRFFEISLIK